MAIDNEKLLTSGEAGAILGVTDERVRHMDDQLLPVRTREGQRIYLASVVHAVAERRAARRSR